MYTECTIQWVDDGSKMDVIIKADNSFEEKDDAIFFYGFDRTDLLAACENNETIEGEWKVISVGETYDKLWL